MMTVIRLVENGVDVGYRVYCKGASEIVLGRWAQSSDLWAVSFSAIFSIAIQVCLPDWIRWQTTHVFWRSIEGDHSYDNFSNG